MINKKLELVNEIDLYISPTINGIGVTITPENDEASFSEYLWKDVVEGLIDAHTVTILKDKDIRLTDKLRTEKGSTSRGSKRNNY